MLFACIFFCLLHSCRPFDCAVNSAYKKYIQWKWYDWDVNSICHRLDYFHRQCNNRHIKMDAELESIHGALDIMTRLYTTGQSVWILAGGLFLDKVFFFRSSFLEPHLFWSLVFGSLSFFFGFTFSSGSLVSFLHLFLSTYICLPHVQVWGDVTIYST
jgi:hypothetical protein